MQESLRKFAQCMGLGKYAAAQLILNQHREDIQKWFGPDHPAQLSVDNNQALLLKMDGNYTEARRMFERVVAKYTGFYGEHHQSTINARINLATVLKDLSLFDEAIPVYELAIEGRRVSEGENTLNFAMAKAMAAGAYRDAGDFDKADAYLKDAYIRVAMDYGEENVTCSAILNS